MTCGSCGAAINKSITRKRRESEALFHIYQTSQSMSAGQKGYGVSPAFMCLNVRKRRCFITCVLVFFERDRVTLVGKIIEV